MLSIIRHCVQINTLRKVYYALVHSYLRYRIIAWGNASKTVLNKLQVIVNRTIRIITFAPFRQINLNPLYEILEILKVSDIYTLEIAKIAYKQNKNLLPVNIANYFEESYTTTGNRTSSRISSRAQANINPETSDSIQVKIKCVWNEIPDEIRATPFFTSFKKMYKSHLALLYF